MNQIRIPVISVRNVTASIAGKTIVSDVNFEVNPGTKVALVGTNGAGKSTLLRAIAGINPPTAGQVLIDGESVADMKLRRRAKIMAFVAQEEVPSADLTVGEMVCLGRIPHRPPWAVSPDKERDLVVESLARVGLADRIDVACDHLSGGEKRRAMLARGLAQNCPVLMLDEPTNHLDIAWTLQMLDFLAHLRMTVIAAIHDLDLVLRYFDTVVVLHDGAMLACGSPVDVLSCDLVADAFGVDAIQSPHPVSGKPHLLISQRKECP